MWSFKPIPEGSISQDSLTGTHPAEMTPHRSHQGLPPAPAPGASLLQPCTFYWGTQISDLGTCDGKCSHSKTFLTWRIITCKHHAPCSVAQPKGGSGSQLPSQLEHRSSWKIVTTRPGVDKIKPKNGLGTPYWLTKELCGTVPPCPCLHGRWETYIWFHPALNKYVYPGCSHFDNGATSKIDDVLFEHGRLLYILPLADHPTYFG